MVEQLLLHHLVIVLLGLHTDPEEVILHISDVRIVTHAGHPRPHVNDLISSELL